MLTYNLLAIDFDMGRYAVIYGLIKECFDVKE